MISVLFEISQSHDDIPQCRQRLIDFLTLFQPLPSCPRDSDSFRTSQIHQIKFTHSNLLGLFPFLLSHLFYCYLENGMTSTRHIIQFGFGSGPSQGSLLYESIDLIGVPNHPLRQSLYKHSLLLIFSLINFIT